MKITSNFINEISITHLVKTDVNNLTKIQALIDQPLNWCNGFLFCFTEIDCDELLVKQTQGVWYLEQFTYAESEKVDSSKFNGYAVEVIDTTGHNAIEKITEYLK